MNALLIAFDLTALGIEPRPELVPALKEALQDAALDATPSPPPIINGLIATGRAINTGNEHLILTLPHCRLIDAESEAFHLELDDLDDPAQEQAE